jgi:hypothetical protein
LTHGVYTLPSGDLTQAFHTYGLVWNETTITTYIDTPSNVVLNVDTSSISFWNRGGWNGSTLYNPWQDGAINAPFDQRFYLIINLAVGGTNGYFPDGMAGKPWTDASANAVNEFWGGVGNWYPTWPQHNGSGTGSPMVIDSVRVWQQAGGDYAIRPML